MFRKHMFFGMIMVIACAACLTIGGCAGAISISIDRGNSRSNSSDWILPVINGATSYTTSGVFTIHGQEAWISVTLYPAPGWIPIAGAFKEEPSKDGKWIAFGSTPRRSGNPWENRAFKLKNHRDRSERRLLISITFAHFHMIMDHGEPDFVKDGEIIVVKSYTFYHKPAKKKKR